MKIKTSKCVSGKRKISDLLSEKRTVYIYLGDAETSSAFMKNAEEEDFLFGDGVLPAKRKSEDIMAVCDDKTICYVGFVGKIAFNIADKVHQRKPVRVDYKKYSNGERKYIIKKSLRHNIQPQN